MFRRKVAQSPEEACVAKLNADAKARELRPPTPYLHPTYGSGSSISRGVIAADTLVSDSITAGRMTLGNTPPQPSKAKPGDIWFHPDDSRMRRWDGYDWQDVL